MGDTGFRVQPGAISGYAATVTGQSEQLGQIQSATAGIAISADAFGHLPNAQNLAQVYQEHASASSQNLNDLVQALTGTADGLNYTAQNYAEQDQAISAGLGGGQ
ncbi:type VII secretion target [Kitasatospora sp. MAP5-34]|uniref:type VII secretion target n=1 Tax=Kitasatospora sp. MAP5-34 TaxID=3035102 RepID=UPI002475EECD|nr:type VII secretion target [Kitasatospora sp. MAP5-34]MDH6577980.1 uncharacterized protein YukE [Kitasatospora sp. MAP5-34]